MPCCSNKISGDSHQEGLFLAHTIWPRQSGRGSAAHSQLGTLHVKYSKFQHMASVVVPAGAETSSRARHWLLNALAPK